MRDLLGSNSGLISAQKRTGRRGCDPADPVVHGTMTQPTNPQNATDPTDRWPSADAVVVVGSDVTEPEAQ